MKKFRDYLLQNKITPQWAIFVLDIFISVFALLFAYCLRFNFDFSFIHSNDLLKNAIVVVSINSTLFYLFRTYQGIIRYSGFREAIRSVAAIFYSFFIMFLINGIMSLSKLQQITPLSVLVIYFFTAAFIIYGYRLLVKFFYKQRVSDIDGTNVVIYGAQLNGSVLKKTIEQTSNYDFKVIAFIDAD